MSNLTITYTKKKKRPSSSSHVDLSMLGENVCIFCRSDQDCEEEYGKVIKKCGFTVHYFCMLFSSGLSQRGKESQGIFGFLPQDIRRELSRGNRLKCSYCKEKGATIGCVVSSCRRAFHLTCGRSKGSLHQFFDSFRSYCPEHRPRQAVQISDRLAFVGTANTVCSICMYSVVARTSSDTLRAPCCKNSWFHRSCIQRYAMSAGLYFFKCPLCNSKDLFQSEMLQYGIYIPDQDAAWEREPNAFQELYERYAHCDADRCKCPHGRDHDMENGKWEVLVCNFCGSHGSHSACGGLKILRKYRVCAECEEIDKKTRHKGSKKSTKIRHRTQAELQHLLQERVAELVANKSKKSHSKKPSSKHTTPSPSPRSRESTPGSRRSLRSHGLGDPEVHVMQKADSDTEVDVEATDSDRDERGSRSGLRKRKRVSLSVSQSKNSRRSSSSVSSNVEVESSGQSCSASIHTTALGGKYSNYVTVSTVRDSDVRQWGTSDATTQEAHSGLRQSSLVNFTSDDEDDTLTIASSDDGSDSEICAVDEVHEDASKKTVTIKWKGKKIRIYKEMEKDDHEDITKWSLHLEVGDVSENQKLVPRTPQRALPHDTSPPQLVPIDEEITIKCTPTTRPYMLNMNSRSTSRSELEPPELSPVPSELFNRVTRSRATDENMNVDVHHQSSNTSLSERGARYSKRSLEKAFCHDSKPGYSFDRQRGDDTDSVVSAANSVITLSSNASENGDDSESDCLIVEPVYVTSNERNENEGRIVYSAQIAVGSPFREQGYPSLPPYRHFPMGGNDMFIDLTGSPTSY